MPEEIVIPQRAEDRALLEELAEKLGVTPEELARRWMQREMKERTRPKPTRGVVQPFQAGRRD